MGEQMSNLVEESKLENKRLERQWEKEYNDAIHIEGKRDMVIIPMSYVREKRKHLKLIRKLTKWGMWLFWFVFSTIVFYQLLSKFL